MTQTPQITYDEQLNNCLAAIKNGDKSRFQELVEITYGPLINVARMYLDNKSDAKYVVTDVYNKIFLYAGRYNTSKSARNYIWEIVKRKAYDYNKSLSKDKTVNIDDYQIFDNVDQFELADKRMDLERAMTHLDATDEKIVRLSRRGMTQEEIGKELNMTKSAVNQRLTKAKRKLSEIVKPR